MPSEWNDGMMEYWNVDLKRMLFIYLIFCQEEFYNNPFSHFHRTHNSSIPLFHYSNCERSEHSSYPVFWHVLLSNFSIRLQALAVPPRRFFTYIKAALHTFSRGVVFSMLFTRKFETSFQSFAT